MTSAQQQLYLEAEEPPTSAGGNTPAGAPDDGSEPAPLWLQRTSLVVLVLFCFYIGALLAVLPWSPRYWDQNGWLLAHHALQTVLEHGWVRGVVSGIGVLDIWIGVSELLHYRDYRR